MLIGISMAFCNETIAKNSNVDKQKDTSLLKKVIINTIKKNIDSLNYSKVNLYVVRIEDSIPPENECFFSMSYIVNRSELYIVKPTHYLIINDKVVFVRCHNLNFAKKIGLDIITDTVKESALKVLCDDSNLNSVWISYDHNYYYFHYKDGITTTQVMGPMFATLKEWVNRNNLKYLYKEKK